MSFDATTKRMIRSRELTEDGNKLLQDGRFTSPVLLYLSALEMLGWEVIDQTGISNSDLPAPKSGKGKRQQVRLHQVRHFAAASIYVIETLRYDKDTAALARNLDFTKLDIEAKLVRRDGKPFTERTMKGQTSLMKKFIEPLENLPQIMSLPQSGLRFARIHALDFQRRAAVGYLDNNRLSIIHQDNKFTYTNTDSTGSVQHSQDPNLEAAAGDLSIALSNIWRSFEEPLIIDCVQHYLRDMFACFEILLTTNSYHENT